MPDPKKQNKKNKKGKTMGAQAKKSKVTKPTKPTKPLKRGDKRPDGSIVGGIVGTKPTKTKTTGKAPSNKIPFETVPKNEIDKTTGKKYDDSESGRKARLAREKAAGMRDEMGYQTSSYESGGAAPKNLGTVSDGTPFYKRGPLYVHGPDGTHPTDPTKEAKAKAEAKKKAEANASKGKRVYGKTTRTKTTDDTGVTTYTASTPYTTSGRGNATTKKSYKQLAAEGGDVEAAKKFNANATLSGVETRSFKTFNLKPKGIKFTPPLPTADITIPKVPKKSKPPMPTFSMSKGRSGGGTTKLIDFNNNRVNKTKSGSGNSCGCS